MSTVTFNDKTYKLDEQGFLDPSNQWDENFAQGMAKELGIRGGLTDRHWHVILYVRQKFELECTVPVQVSACADNGIRLHELRALFPTGYHRGVCKIAGVNYKFMYETNYWLTYETAPPKKPRYHLDPVGFLANVDEWDEDFAVRANQEFGGGQPMSQRHWLVIRYLRDYYAEHQTIPPIHEMGEKNGLTLEDMRSLFPAVYRRGACLMAGLPFFG